MSKHKGLRITGYNKKAQCWVVQTPEGHIFAECPETVYSEGHERAKKLVDSVNNHDRLVEALLECVSCFNCPEWSDQCETAEQNARALLEQLDTNGGKS